MKNKLLGALFTFSLLLVSCTEEINQDQYDSTNLEAEYKIEDFVLIELNSFDFILEGAEIKEVKDSLRTSNLFKDVFGTKTLIELKTNLTYVNEFDRGFSIEIGFYSDYDDANSELFVLDEIAIEPSNLGSGELTVSETLQLTLLENLDKIIFKVKLFPSDNGAVLDITDTSILKIESSLTVKVNRELNF